MWVKTFEVEVEEADAIDRFQAEVPLLVPSLHLAGEGAREVVEDTVGEMRLAAVLHLHDEFAAVFRAAKEVIDHAPLVLRQAIQFLVQERFR